MTRLNRWVGKRNPTYGYGSGRCAPYKDKSYGVYPGIGCALGEKRANGTLQSKILGCGDMGKEIVHFMEDAHPRPASQVSL